MNRHRRGGIAAAALCASLLQGCATLTGGGREQAESRWTEQRSAVSSIQAFELRARVASNAVGLKADVLWQQAADGAFDLRISGPFGAGAMTLRGNEYAVEIATREGVFTTDDPELWLQQRLGWTLPIGGLRWWVLGLPSPRSVAQLELDAQGQLLRLRQDGWQLVYSAYASAGTWQLPRRFEASNGVVSLRVLADQWSGLHAAP